MVIYPEDSCYWDKVLSSLSSLMRVSINISHPLIHNLSLTLFLSLSLLDLSADFSYVLLTLCFLSLASQLCSLAVFSNTSDSQLRFRWAHQSLFFSLTMLFLLLSVSFALSFSSLTVYFIHRMSGMNSIEGAVSSLARFMCVSQREWAREWWVH